MSTLILDKVLSGYNLAKVNDNFERIEKAFNEALLHRDGSKELLDDLDVNSQKLLNVGGIEIGGVDIVESIASLQEEYNAYISTMDEYKAAVDEILEEAISYGAVDQKSIGNAQRVFTTSQTYAVNSNMTLPLPYVVGKNTLKLNLGHYYELYKGVDYEEVGVVGNQSTTIKLLRTISSGVEIEEFVDGDNDLYSIYATAEALQELLTTSYSPESIEEFVNSVSDIQELGLEDKIAQLNSLYDSLVSLQTSLQTTVADINTKYSTITDMYEDVGTKYSLLETLYPQLLALLADTDFDLDGLNEAVGELNTAVSDLNDLAPVIEGYKDDAETAATSAESSASSASTSATNAANSASSAAGALTNAQIWAEGTDGQVGTLGGEHSSKGWAEQAREYIIGNIVETLGYTPADQTDLTAESTARQNADAALQTAIDGKVSKSGDTMAGSLKTAVSEFIQRTVDNLYNRFCGGSAYDKGASLTLFGKDHASQAGQIIQRAYDGTDAAVSQITPSGQFSFQGLPIENRSCYVGQSGDGTASPWFKVGSFTTTSASAANTIALLEIESILESEKRYGLLHVKMRLNSNRDPDASRTFLEWGNAVNINPDDFVLLLNSDSTTSYFDLYVRCPKKNLRYTFKVLSEKSSIAGNNAQSRVFTLENNISTGSLASLPPGTQIKSKFRSKVKCGKRIVFTADFKCPDYDELMSKTYQQGATNRYIWPQAANRFVKNGVEYLFVLLGASTDGNGTGTFTQIVTVYNLDIGEYLGYWLLPNVPTTEGIVVRTETDGDYIYTAKGGNTLQKFKFALGTYKTTLTGIDVVDPDGNPVPVVWFLSYLNGTWCIDGIANRIGGFSSRTLFFYDDNFKRIGQYDVQKYEQDVWNSYEGLTAEQQKVQWSIPRTQAISIGIDGVYFYKGGGTNAADTTFPITDCGVDHFNLQGDLVRSSVCRHTPFANKLLPLLGVTSAINHTECEGGYCTDDGRCFWFAVVGGQSGKIVLMEEFSDAPDAVDFSDCLANRQSNIPFQSNRPSFPHGISSKIDNPWTGETLTSVDEFIKMCAIWGLDDVYVSNYSAGLGTTIYNTEVSPAENFALHVRRYNYNRFFVEVIRNSLNMPRTYVVGVDSNFNVNSCTLQRNFNDGSIVTVVESGTNYKRYSDGTQECWGGGTTSSTPTAVDFPKAFSEAPTVVISGQSGSVDMQMGLYKAAAVSASGFTPVATNITATSYAAIMYCYIARGKYSA